jgi:hypothetical protein
MAKIEDYFKISGVKKINGKIVSVDFKEEKQKSEVVKKSLAF